ncbi:MAG TPA: MEDS domain-containing protein [Solirubrobacteraceae bacterium]
MSDRGTIGARVTAARKRLGWTREGLAFHSGISWSAIAQIEPGRRTNLRPSTLTALSRALGVSIDYLVDGGQLPPAMLDHSAFPYRTDDQFRTTVGPFLAEGIERSEALLAVTTGPNIELLREHLGKDARSVEFVDANGFYTSPAAALKAFRAFSEASLERGATWVRVVGEPMWAGTSDAEVRLWTRYESLFNLVFAASPLTVVCPYDERCAAPEIVRQAHLTHPHMVGDQGLSPSPDYLDPSGFALEPG